MVDVQTQLICFWVSVGLCFLGTLFFVTGLSFKKEGLLKYGSLCSYLAFLPMAAALIMRWIETGHIPSISKYEVFTIYPAGVLLFYLVVQILRPSLRIAGTVVLPFVMLMTAIGVMSSTELTQMPKTYSTYWLGIHMLFATLALGGVMVSAGLAVLYLIKSSREERGKVNSMLERLPALGKMDYLGYRFNIFAFVMIGLMIASGSIWAYQSWGRYWNWDPIETWSLICWLVYGAYLHLRIMGVKGKLASWLGIGLIAVVVFSFFGAPYLYPTIHDRFVTGTGL